MTETPKISYFMYSENADLNNDQNKVQAVINPLHMIILESFPGRFSFSIVFALLGFDTLKDHTLFVKFVSPNGEIIIETEKIALEKENSNNEDSSRLNHGMSLGIDFRNVLFENAGLYNTEIYFDEKLINDFPIPVMKRSEE